MYRATIFAISILTAGVAHADDAFGDACIAASNEGAIELADGQTLEQAEEICVCIAEELKARPALVDEFMAGLDVVDPEARVSSLSEDGRALLMQCV